MCGDYAPVPARVNQVLRHFDLLRQGRAFSFVNFRG
jgi:hypothetical protein